MIKFVITKKGKDVFDDLEPNDYIFNSDYNTFKILAQGTLLNQTVNTHPKVFTLVHGLGYVPNFYAFARFPDGKVVLAGPHSVDFTSGGPSTGYGAFTPEADESGLYFGFETSFISGSFPGSYNVDISWFIFESSL